MELFDWQSQCSSVVEQAEAVGGSSRKLRNILKRLMPTVGCEFAYNIGAAEGARECVPGQGRHGARTALAPKDYAMGPLRIYARVQYRQARCFDPSCVSWQVRRTPLPSWRSRRTSGKRTAGGWRPSKRIVVVLASSCLLCLSAAVRKYRTVLKEHALCLPGLLAYWAALVVEIQSKWGITPQERGQAGDTLRQLRGSPRLPAHGRG